MIDRLVWVSRIGINDQERPAIAVAVELARACVPSGSSGMAAPMNLSIP